MLRIDNRRDDVQRHAEILELHRNYRRRAGRSARLGGWYGELAARQERGGLSIGRSQVRLGEDRYEVVGCQRIKQDTCLGIISAERRQKFVHTADRGACKK